MNDSEQSFVSSMSSQIDRLRNLSQIDILTGWRLSLGAGGSIAGDTSQWDVATLNEKGQIAWERGRQELWLAQQVVMPTEIAGYPLTNLSCRLALTWWAELAQVFINGELVQEGDLFDFCPRILLMPSVVAGTSVDVRLRLVSPGHDIGALMRSRLIFESLDATLPEPGWIADELAVMMKRAASFQPAQLGEMAAIIDTIDYNLLAANPQQFIHQTIDLKHQVKSIIHQPLATLHLLGHAHLDMAWLWEVGETWQAAERTFRSSLKLQQLFPDLTFCHSTPALYEWMEINQPEVFAKICQQVKAGKWEIVGGMWIEPDLNLISGESIARQIIYAQAYDRSRFGADTRVAWLPDTFGFCWQLPQLLQQGNIDYFVTQKLLWNDTTKFPHQLFWWESPDGSRVLSYFSSLIGEGVDPVKMTDYVCGWQQNTGIAEAMYLIGIGDHGGGPTQDMLELAQRWSKSDVFPDLEFTTAVKYLDTLASREDSRSFPVWNNELYLEFHRGCFTTHAEQKRSNRQAEDLLYQAELWSSLACMVADRYYPEDLKLQIETAWKQTLFNQFHDIIPGSAIEPVYVTANQEWEQVERVTTQIIGDALNQISDRILLPEPPVANAIPIIVFNALNWSRTEVVSYPIDPRLFQEIGDLNAWCVFDDDGKILLSQSSPTHLSFLATDLPSVGYRLFWLTPKNPLLGGVPVGGGGLTMETLASSDFIFKNQYLQVEINPITGDIDRLFDRIQQREILTATGANHLQAFQDGEQYWDAWNIDPKYAEKPLPPSQLKSHGSPSAPAIEWIDRGELRQRVRVVRTLAGCDFTQDYILDIHSPVLRIDTSVDWQAEHVLIKANFPLNINADRSTAETACGAISRTTKPETAAEKAQWELPMHRWVDLTDNSGEYGVSLLNDCKYGFDAGTDYLRITLLRGTNWPDPTADRGYHEFSYAIYPHSGTWQAAQTVRKGLEFNSPLQVISLDSAEPTLRERSTNDSQQSSATQSLLDLGSPNLVLMAFKPSDDPAQRWVLRCYECHGIESTIELTSDLDLNIDRVVNLLEAPLAQSADTTITPWQIRSFGIS